MIFSFERRFQREILIKSLWGGEKWILQKILHRYSDPKNFETKKFSSKKIFFWNRFFFFEIENIFFENEEKNLHSNFFPSAILIFFPIKKFQFFLRAKIFLHFQKKYFRFQKNIFFDDKKNFSKIFGSQYRCKIFWRIHFSHPRSDLTSISNLTEL